MHLVVRVNNIDYANELEIALKGSVHVISLQTNDLTSVFRTDAEFLTLGMAETLGLPIAVRPLEVLIAGTPKSSLWLPAPMIVYGMMLDQEYEPVVELDLLLHRMWISVTDFNKSSPNKIDSIGAHINILNMHGLSISGVAKSILSSFGP